MSENLNQAPTPEKTTEENPGYIPASIYKRVWAWVGVVYMVIITLLVTYFIATWTFLTGLAGIMLFPVLGGFAVVKGIQAHRMEYAADKVGPIVWSALSAALCIVCLVWGITQVMAHF